MENKPITRKESIEVIKSDFLQLTDEKTFMREASFAIQAIRKSPQLQKCSQESIQAAVLNVAQVRLTLNPINALAYLIPRWDKKSGVNICVLEPSYQGLVKLITDTKSVKTIYSYCVYRGDEFEISLGTSAEIKHIPKFESKEIEKVYAVGILPDGTKQIEVMPMDQVEAVRAISESYKYYLKKNKTVACVWVSNEQEMCRKTVIKRLCKYLPKTDQWEYVNKAIELDNVDYTLDIDSSTVEYINGLLRTSGLDEQQKTTIELEIFSGELTRDRADELITSLKMDQLDPIESGNSYSQSDINDKLDRKMNDESE